MIVWNADIHVRHIDPSRVGTIARVVEYDREARGDGCGPVDVDGLDWRKLAGGQVNGQAVGRLRRVGLPFCAAGAVDGYFGKLAGNDCTI